MNNNLPSCGQSDGLGSWHPAIRPNSHRPTSTNVETKVDVPAQEVNDNFQHVLSEEPQSLQSASNSSFPPTVPSQDASSPSPYPINTDEAKAVVPLVQNDTISIIPANGDSYDVQKSNTGAIASPSPFSDNAIITDIFGISQLHDTEMMDDIRFPEYFSSANDEAHGSAEPEVLQSTSEGLSWKKEGTLKTAGWPDQDIRSPTEGAIASSSTSPSHHHDTAPNNSLSYFQAGGHIAGEIFKAELPNDFGGYQSQTTIGEDDGSDINLLSGKNTENMDFFPQLGVVNEAPPLPTDEEARFEEGLPLVPKSTDHEGQIAVLDQPNGQEAASPTWSHGTDDDFFGEHSSLLHQKPSTFTPPPLDRKTTTQVLDSLSYSTHDATHEELGHDDQNSQPAAKEAAAAYSIPTKSSQRDVEDQAKSSAPEKEISSNETREDDLAAMWRAALGDDDLLEEDESAFDPSGFFKNDGEGFLDDNQTQKIEAALPPSMEFVNNGGNMQASGQSGTGPGVHEQNQVPASSMPQANAGPNHSFDNRLPTAPPSQTQFSPSIPSPVPVSTGFDVPRSQSAYSPNAAFSSRPPIPEPKQSFSDKSKEGYTSPYDLPMDFTRPKKRTYLKQMQNASDIRTLSNPPPPPPRSSSVNSAVTSPILQSYQPSPNSSSTTASLPGFNSQQPLARATSSFVGSKPSIGSFFEELPSAKPRPVNIRSRPASGTTHSNPIPQAPFEQRPPHHSTSSQRPASSLSSTSQGYQLLPPERLALYSHTPEEPLNKVPAISSRYSPAPASQSNIPPIQNRYASSSSGPRPHQPPHSMSFQPRKSSPLAQNNSTSQHHQRNSAGDVPRDPHQQSSPMEPHVYHNIPDLHHQTTRDVMQSDEKTQAEMASPRIIGSVHLAEPAPPENRYAPVIRALSKSPYAPQQAMNRDPPPGGPGPGKAFTLPSNQAPTDRHSEVSTLGPPRRSQTQSPGTARPKTGLPLNMQEFVQRPASTNHQAAPIYPRSANVGVSHQEVLRRGNPSRVLNYIVPIDGRERDPLERWKGCPIIAFGFGGLAVTTFPKQIPRYSAGQPTPMVKCSPGEININVGKTLRLDENMASFPGPLKSKSKKREALDWLQKHILHLENIHMHTSSEGSFISRQKCLEEKILLWRILQIFVEHEGVVEGNTATMVLRSLLIPDLVATEFKNPQEQNHNEGVVGISRYSGPKRSSGPSDPGALESIRRLLLGGEREKAVWCAVDQRMWDHAMLLSSTLGPNVWKQVLHEFVRQEVKTSGRNTESLASLYQVFAGNWEESIDELVPPSARAGLQMVSMATGAGPTKNALDGLDRWRETLTLILNNRSQDDTKALVALGRLLSNYGRSEAAHICYIFGKIPGLFGGAEDPQAAIALLGADHHKCPFDYDRDFDNILLSEVYEFATTILSPSTVPVSPHLQAYKLYHAIQLAEYGFKSEAQQYCDSIAAAMKSTTKLSPYYHNLLFGTLDDLIQRLRQAPKDGSSSWMSKPSMDKVSGSVWAKFNQFIAGDESDANSTKSVKGLDQDVNGPFARVSGDSPSLSPTPSSTDLYGGYQTGGGITGSAPTNIPHSRYAPTGQYTPRSSLEQTSSFSQEPRRQSDAEGRRPIIPHAQYQPQKSSPTEIQQKSPPVSYKLPQHPSSYSPQSQPYLPTPPSQPEYTPNAPPVESPFILNENGPYQPIPGISQPDLQSEELHTSEVPSNASYNLPSPDSNLPSSVYEVPTLNTDSSPINAGELPSNGYNPPSYTYEPPSGSYDPPAYNTDTIDDPESPLDKPKKKRFMDDDDDEEFTKRAAALLKEDRARKDREADEAVRKAAEADGKLLFSSLVTVQSINALDSPERTKAQRQEILVRWLAWRQERW